MLSVEEALDRVLSRVTPLATERVDLVSALNRALAEPVQVATDIPAWANSSMDGYALRSEDVRRASSERPVTLRVAGRVPAGAVAARPIAPGEAFKILTGAPLPEGADGVIPQEEVETEGEIVKVPRPVGRGEYVRLAGEDLRAGETVLEPGHEIGAAEVGLLATLGYAQVRVFRRPRVAILSTGDELVDLGGALGPGKIPNSNTYALMAQVAAAGGVSVNLGVAGDSPEAIGERLRWGLDADAVISSAGVSVGEFDFVKEALTGLGAELHLWQVAMRPGKPITFGSLGLRPVFGLPGNPVSAMVTFELFVRPALRKMAGHRTLHRPTIRARALAPIPNPGRRRGYLRVTLTPIDGGHGARLTGEQGSGILRSMVMADGLAVIPPDTTIPEAGEVTVINLR
ncbi:MAG: molybdopterin molybdotransferase MoeA [Candidatus Rokubacteria bacterium]|nr:molybdopterin molybdotransferase MoeA [Candidatus Rokubacteria bacterium]